MEASIQRADMVDLANNGWIGVDLDGTLAKYDGWQGIEYVGAPIPLMVERVKEWLTEGCDVRIFTARVSGGKSRAVTKPIQEWCRTHLGVELPITCVKDFGMIELWDDRCVQIITNTGLRADGKGRG
jgi:hypothetical protein